MANGSILLSNFHLGGIADSKYSGIPNSLAAIVGCNLHSEPGVLKVNQKLTLESGVTVDEEVAVFVPCSDGNTYIFGKGTGKIWKRTSAGVYSLEATNASGGNINAREYQGYIYYVTAAKVGRWQIGSAWGTRNDSYATFTNGNSSYHPMIIKNVVLYIGDGYLVAQIDDPDGASAVFTADALDLERRFVVRSLGEVANDLIVGAFVRSNVVQTKVFRWNSYGFSFTSDDTIPEVGVNCFIPSDNYILVQAGQKGNLYTYNGEQLTQFKRILGDWSSTNEAFVGSEAAANLNGLPLFGLSNGSGNPALQGVYSFGSFSDNYPKVLNLEYVISTNATSNIEISAIAVVGNDVLVAWKSGSTYGVDKVDWTAKYTGAYFETRIFQPDRMNGKNIKVKIAYRSLPSGTAITLQKSVNGAAYATVALLNDAGKSLYHTDVNIADANTCQFKVIFTANGNTAPEIEGMEIIF